MAPVVRKEEEARVSSLSDFAAEQPLPPMTNHRQFLAILPWNTLTDESGHQIGETALDGFQRKYSRYLSIPGIDLDSFDKIHDFDPT
jgi:hypothetical protein